MLQPSRAAGKHNSECSCLPGLLRLSLSQVWHADELVNDSFTLAHASPQLLQMVGTGQPQAMPDQPNDIWAVGTTLFELLMSGHRAWAKEFGTFMFGVSGKDLVEANQLQSNKEQNAFKARKILEQQGLWVRLRISGAVQWYSLLM